MTDRNVEYTLDAFDGTSSFVEDALYNQNTQILYLNLNGTVYAYIDVPETVYLDFVEADSAGAFYRNNIKGKFCTAWKESPNDWIEYNQVPLEQPKPAPTVTNISVGNVSSITNGNSDTYVSLNWDNTPPSTTHKYDLVFEVDGSRKTYSTHAASIEEAVTILMDIAAALDLTFTLKQATVYFE